VKKYVGTTAAAPPPFRLGYPAHSIIVD